MERKRTKIVATLSDKKCDPSFIKELYDAGMDVIRINSAHSTVEGALGLLRNARAVSDKIAVLIDTKGPEIRTTVCDNPIFLKGGTILKMKGNPDCKTTDECICVTYLSFAVEIPIGTVILIDDGELEIRVLSREDDALVCRIENDGTLGSRKTVNIPGIRINLPSVTPRDREFIKMAAEEGIDFIAHSFVRNRQDVRDVKALLEEAGSDIKIIAKIENQEGVDNIDEILEEVYGVMVARGDLAIEVPYEKIPAIQRMLINKCIKARKPVIVATQMLQSMITNPRPTRAEVSDIANAIYSQTDAIMLSGETASGKYPVESVKTMAKVALETEKNKEQYLERPADTVTGEVSAYLAKVAVKTSVRIGAKAIIADTAGGRSIRDMASFRGIKPIMAQCYQRNTVRELALSYGVYPEFTDRKETLMETVDHALSRLEDSKELRRDDIVVVLAGNFSGGAGFSLITVGSVDYLRERINISEK
jgi:pyruvate kinase